MNLDVDAKKKGKDLLLVFGAITTSTGLVQFLPSELNPGYLVLGGIVISHFASKK